MHYIRWLSLYFQGAIVAASLLGYGIFTSRPSFDRTGFRCSFFHLGFLWIRLGNMLFGGLAVVAEAGVARPNVRCVGLCLGLTCKVCRRIYLVESHSAPIPIRATRYQVVRSRVAPDYIELVYDELGVLGNFALA